MSRRRAKKKGSNPLLALLLLIACGSYAGVTLLGGVDREAAPGLASLLGGDVAEPIDSDVPAVEEIRWTDLLAVHGSYEAGAPVRLAFAAVVEATPALAAPVGETEIVGRWRGQDPPQLRLGVVLVSAASRRAVLGGRVVGVGDQVAEGEIVAIEPGFVRLRWNQRELTYDLDGEAPREFRGELAMRQAASAATGSASDQFQQVVEEERR